MKKISVIIPSHNSCMTIADTIKSVRHQTRADLIEGVIIADSSDDAGTRRLLEELQGPGLTIVAGDAARTPAQNRNSGAAHARGDVLAFIDADVILSPDWVEKISRACREGARAGAGAVRLPEAQRRNRFARAQYYLQFNEFMPYGRRVNKRIVPSCNLFCDKEVFHACGGFPDVRASEDVLFSLEVSRRHAIAFLPDAVVEHVFDNSWQRLLGNQFMLGAYNCRRRRLGRWGFMFKGFMPVVTAPVFVAVKFVRILSRIIRAPGAERVGFLLSLDLFMAGLLACGWGFAVSDFTLKKEGGARDEEK